MITQFKNRLKRTNSKIHHKLIEWFSKPDYQADVFVKNILIQVSKTLEKKNISDTEFAKKADVNKSAVSQFFDKDGNVKVKTLFKYLNVLGLSIKEPELIQFNAEKVYQEYQNEINIELPVNNYEIKSESYDKAKIHNINDYRSTDREKEIGSTDFKFEFKAAQ